MNCKVFKEEILKLKSEDFGAVEIAKKLNRPVTSVKFHFYERESINVRRRRKRRKIEIDNYKVSKGCYICSESDPRVLQFHHVDPEKKDGSISRMLSQGHNLKSLMKEISKCDVVCANCHLKLHNEI